jgi:hypothetical protein
VPRRLGLGQLRALRALARQVTTLLELRHGAAQVAREAVRGARDRTPPRRNWCLLAGSSAAPLAELRRSVEVLRDLDFCPAEVAARLGRGRARARRRNCCGCSTTCSASPTRRGRPLARRRST